MSSTTAQRQDGPGWPIRPAAAASDSSATLTGALLSPQALRWYFGAVFSLFWAASSVTSILGGDGPLPWRLAGVVLLVVYCAAFVVAPPLAWTFAATGRLVTCAGLLALSFTLLPWLDRGTVTGLWTYVGVLVGMCVFTWSATLAMVGGLAMIALAVRVGDDGWTETSIVVPVLIVSLSLMMATFARTIATVNQLRATQAELEILTAERERSRVARDIHDILGHSLTVIAVKSELAGRLLDADPERARAEIADVESLARGALKDVRATVAGFRATTASGELAAARGALTAAGVTPELPSSTDAVLPAHRELVGWVIREGVTNVVRHAHASRCRVRLTAAQVEIADDGVGPRPGSASSTGLVGLSERVEAAGGRMSIGTSELGGFSLRVHLPEESR
ncbi:MULTISPECIES: sensor histidine kinase [unclassified Rathayibacter]|uniref:sensor histidine kinase n=1 Tax=unclassified Rathayibacter TaxID=2609250 RepID=UPI00188C1466|nr:MULTISPECIES: sensor histidine kinase [unclassified Rathayibacter]MBF4463005.1 sensor histidine kinase [Rathayibacter sp. VKM Ac-2879]MBF4504419.1 sensor histidine kinase [Rathayibacter sp. VKM Ac-2878]